MVEPNPKGFGITALIYSLVSALDPTFLLFRGSVGVVVGIFVMRYDEAKHFRILGVVIIVSAVIPFLGSGILSGVVLWKGIKALGVLSREGHNDEEWAPSRRRAMTGAVTSFIGLLISTAGAQLIFIVIAKLYAWL